MGVSIRRRRLSGDRSRVDLPPSGWSRTTLRRSRTATIRAPRGARRAPGAAEHAGPARGRSAAWWAAAGGGAACVVVGVLLAVAPDAPVDVGTLPTAAVSAAPVAAAAPARSAPAPAPSAPALSAPALSAPGTSAPRPAAVGTVPVAVALPDRGVSAPVVATGTEADGELAIPDPPTTVGWWSPGALAGAPTGTTVLVGHVDSAVAGLGTFAVLREVAVGERVVVTGTDGRLLAYRVVARRQIGKADLPADLFARGGPPRLVLVTCGGRFDATIRHYTDNVIVYAEPA